MAEEKRQYSRVPVEIRVEYQTVEGFLVDWTCNISGGGMFVRSENPLPIGTLVRLVFSLPEIPSLFDLNGEIKWIQTTPTKDLPHNGMGIEFIRIDENIRMQIEAYIKIIDKLK